MVVLLNPVRTQEHAIERMEEDIPVFVLNTGLGRTALWTHVSTIYPYNIALRVLSTFQVHLTYLGIERSNFNILLRASEAGSPKTRLGSRPRRDTKVNL